MKNHWLALIPVALLAVLVVVAWQQLSRSNPAPASFSSPERPIPTMQLEALDGPAFSFADLKGKPYLVNFWATWCVPCRAEHPVLIAMKGEGVDIIGVLYKDPKGPSRELLAKEGNPFSRIALDPAGDLGLEVGISGVPETFLVDANGQIVKTMRGPVIDRGLARSFIDAYRAELAKPAAPPAG